MPELNTTQQILWRLITAPEGVARALEDWPDRDRWLPGGLEALVRSDEVSALERLDVYANMYFFRLLDCLKEDFPGLALAFGDASFHNLVTDYLLAHPSEHPSVCHLGRHMAAFLEDHSAARERPWLPDLARLEWALLEAFDAPDAEPIGAERLRAIPPEAWAGLHLRLTPSLRVIEASSAVHEILVAVAAGRAPEAPTPGAVTIRAWRQDLRVHHRAVGEDEAAALRAAGDGESFAELCERLAAIREGQAAARAVEILTRWLADGLVIGLEV